MAFLGIALPLGTELAVVAIAVVYTIASIFLQRKLANPKRAREIQMKVKQMTNELNLMVKSGAAKEDINRKQSEMMPLMGESMKSQLKPMLVILPIFLLVYYVLLPIPFGATAAKSVQLLFFYVVFGLGLVASAAILLYDRAKMKKEQVLEVQKTSV